MNGSDTFPATRAVGVPHKRVDGKLKVTGAAQYAADYAANGLTYGFVVSSTIASGRIVAIDASAALELPGVLLVLTHLNRPPLPLADQPYKDMVAPGGTPFRPLWDDRVWYSGQPVALVVAETLELARHAASLVKVRYEHTPHQTEMSEALMSAVPPSTEKGGFDPPPSPRGDADRALASAAVRVDGFYSTPAEYHNPMEMHGCTVVPDEHGHLIVYEKTQGVVNTKRYLTAVFGLKDDEVQVESPFVGGAFGSGLRPQYHLPLAVMAARDLKRPVRVTLTRQQMFTFAHRPQSIQRVALGASADGKLQAVIHEAVAETSRYEDYCDVLVNWAGQLYACENVTLGYKVVKLDVPTPADMRAPGAAQGLFPLETAMDELAEALQMDPLQLRLINYAERDANKNLPFSSKALRDCYREGAARFGWEGRPLAPRARREGRELIGWGMATGAWDAMQNEAAARAVLTPDGRVEVSSSTADIGTGTYTAMTQIAADALGVSIHDVDFELGDTRLPKAPIEGGSWTVSSVGSAVHVACERLRNRLVELARQYGGGRFAMVARDEVRRAGNRLVCGSGSDDAIGIDALLARAGLETLEEQASVKPHEKQQAYSMGTHSAVFAEVRVDEALGTVRVTRVVSAVAAGRIVNPKTAANQIAGGVVWGIGMALHEHGQFDHALGRQMNHNLAEYHIPVNADIHDIDVLFVNEHDDIVNPLGVKGVGEIGVVGVAAAVGNAIWHATGKRVRDLPITLDKLFA
ncbi:xanthine dehydrogenase family protein molybdopterin-binding subunit [Paraburkholderia terricola]|uniref:Xanthine dehydrogenase, molybdenum binding subunit apoprotein n=1 Tax=Paraburkholderia terricola TaxID=169427 RepID=A0A1M6MVG4_9BURK|nr:MULTISPECIES: xanthine dehydrogenase family protein molybdopterin-binding subunit [Paraburkholderia]ORC52507.1 aldehyde oxidase [Burkholderia sp. A27]SDO03393.1 xanthine dehydrogenase, molybdenum binding subunit apoprotein [Paraburkholderia sediminicola]SHJ87406.1 xanthine dehydrogenase, molybdenum binding subunit apoprotein [Paraburkholderia terricola]